MQRILVGSDHAGYTLKVGIRDYLLSLKYDVIDVGTHDKSSCHYPDFALKMAKLIQPNDRGVLICGSGIGIGIAANKAGLPCATAYNEYTARECGRHFRVMAMGERVVPLEAAKLMVTEFLKSK
jgi:ribose 5-phosphate isomerase B